jgi:hypothetical protein
MSDAPQKPPAGEVELLGLGDRVEAVFRALGATKSRMEVLAMVLGWDNCGCEDRKEWLNAIGKKLGIGG